MNTRESNKLIAEFMGFIPDEYEKRAKNGLQYHKSWNWLMPVLEKISFDSRIEIETDEEGDNVCAIETEDWGFIGDSAQWKINQPLMETIYNSVVDYVKWHKSNKVI